MMIHSFNLSRILETELHIKYGIQSGIPLCCVAFFVTEWLDSPEERRDEHRKFLKWHEISVNYIPCPNCIISGNLIEANRRKFSPLERIESVPMMEESKKEEDSKE